MNNEFKIFKWQDAVTYGLSVIITTGLMLYAQFNGRNDGVLWLGWLVALMFWGAYSIVIYSRYSFKKQLDEESSNGRTAGSDPVNAGSNPVSLTNSDGGR